MKNIFKSNWVLLTISFLSAIIIWVYVSYNIDPIFETTIKDVPVSYGRYSQEFTNGKLVLTSVSHETANITIKGKRGQLSKVTREHINCFVDMSAISSSGTHKVPIGVTFNVSGMELVSKEPYSVNVKVDDVITHELNIEVETKGSPEQSYVYDSLEYDIDKVRISGAKNIVSKVKKARVTVDISGRDESINGRYKIILEDKDGNEISEEGINKNIAYIEVTCNILLLKEINVVPELSSDKNYKGESVSATPAVKTIKVLGSKALVEELEEIRTKPVDVRYVKDGDKTTVTLEALPETVKMEEKIENVEITFEVKK